MDKVAADERRRQWINYSSTTECGGAGNVCGRAACFPCGAYARTSARLRLALNGRDATDIDSKQALSADCWQFALCFPFYGCLIAKLQTTVRSFYDIDGSDVQDWVDGFCCPCCTLSRNEEEIVLREKQNQKLKSLRESFLEESSPPSEYKSHVPMVYVSHDHHHHPVISSPPRSKSANFEGKDVDDDVAALAPIPELSREVSNVAPAAEATVLQPISEVPNAVSIPIRAGRQSPEHNAGHGGHGNGKRWPLMQYLGRRWYLVPADKKENEKPKSDDATAPEETTEKITPRHSLDDDGRYATHAVSRHAAHGLEEHSKVARDANKSRFKEHLLEEDSPSPARPLPLGSPHRLGTDPLVSRVHASKSHHLETDSSTSAPIPSTSSHQLEGDSTAKTTVLLSPHHLENDPLESTRPKGLWPGVSAKHDITHDENIAIGAKLTTPHELDEDAPAGGPANKTHLSHAMETDEVQGKLGASASHSLDNDTAVTASGAVAVNGSVQGHQKEETETAGHKLAKAASHLFSGAGK